MYVGGKLVKQVYVGSKKVYPDEGVIPKQIRDAMVLWYDIKKQGATNESMAENPVLVDHSGNGHDATCYNFAWTEESGISTTEYPNALVADGVDDYAMVEGLPLLTKEKGFTVIANRTWIGDINSKSQGFVSKGSSAQWVDGAFYFEGVEGNGSQLFNRVFGQGGNNVISKFVDGNFTYMTSKQYNSTLFKNIGDGIDTDKMIVFALVTSKNYLSQIALRTLLLFDRDLTTDEIEWVKTNLMS